MFKGKNTMSKVKMNGGSYDDETKEDRFGQCPNHSALQALNMLPMFFALISSFKQNTRMITMTSFAAAAVWFSKILNWGCCWVLTVDKKLRFWVFEVVFVTDVNRDLLELKSFLRIEFQWCADDYFVSVHSVNGEVRSNRKQRGMKVAESTMLKKSRVQVGPKFKEGLKMNLNFH